MEKKKYHFLGNAKRNILFLNKFLHQRHKLKFLRTRKSSFSENVGLKRVAIFGSRNFPVKGSG